MSAQPERPDVELTIEDFLDVPSDVEPEPSDVSEFERLTGVTTLVQEQTQDTDRVVDDTVTRDIEAGLEDGHDYSDCGGDS